MLPAIKELALRKPMYGSRMLAARLSKELGRPVNRKLVQHAFRMMGWTIPQMTKKQLIGATHEKPKPTAIDQDWETDMTYIWCGDRQVVLPVQRPGHLLEGVDRLRVQHERREGQRDPCRGQGGREASRSLGSGETVERQRLAVYQPTRSRSR